MKSEFRTDDNLRKFKANMAEKGLQIDEIIPDGKIHRFQVVNGSGKPASGGWYVYFADGCPSGAFGNWRTGEKWSWCSKNKQDLTQAEREAFKRTMADVKHQREKVEAEQHQKAKDIATKIWETAKPVNDHPYLIKKQVAAYGLRQAGNERLIVPVLGESGDIQSHQFIDKDGEKRFLTGSKMHGGYFRIAGDPIRIAICEGYATGATVHQATGYTVYIAFNCGNLEAVCRIAKKQNPAGTLIVCADNDHLTPGNPGQFHGKTAAASIQAQIVTPIFSNPAKDTTDFNDLARVHGIDAVKMQIEVATADSEPEAVQEWSEPFPIQCELLPVEPFKPEWLPDALREWVKDIADRMQCPIDYPAIGAMVVLSSLAGKKMVVKPKEYDDWLSVPNLWGCIIGRPSAKKTPSLEQCLKPLHRLEIEAKTEHERQHTGWMLEKNLSDMHAEAAKAKAKEAIKKGNTESARNILSFNNGLENPAPTRKRFVVNDTTVEKLGEILAENPNGILIYRDELFGFLKTINREDRSNDRAFYLEAWNGLGRYSYDRIGRGTIDIESCIVSILGCLTPSKLVPMVSMAVDGGIDDDGFLQRFQLMIYPDQTPWRYVDRFPNKDARDDAFEFLKWVSAQEFPKNDEYCQIPVATFSPQAQKLFIEWLTELESEIASPDIHPAIESHLAKYRSLIPSIALLLHMGAWAEIGQVQIDELEKAIAWGKYLKSHALRIYGLAVNNKGKVAKLLLDKIKAGKLDNPFTIRNIKRVHWQGLADDSAINMALNTLTENEYLRAVDVKKPIGRPTVEYHINPKILGNHNI